MKDYTDIIYSPVVTEKSVYATQKGVYTFKVAGSANKTQIKKAVEAAFGVNVVNVNTLNTKSKKKRVGKYTGKTKTYKKVIVTLASGQSIEF